MLKKRQNTWKSKLTGEILITDNYIYIYDDAPKLEIKTIIMI